jgi:hypothetical protein
MLAATTGPDALRHFAEGNGSIVRRVGLLDDVVRSAGHEPDAVAVRTRSEGLRRDGYRDIIEHLASEFGLRDGLTVETATDVLLTLAGPALYRDLVVDYAWSHDAFIDWQAGTLAQVLLRAPELKRRGASRFEEPSSP